MGSGEELREIRVALSGNPNVGKSTLFNSLTGMNVHTGNWAGKTVGEAQEKIIYSGCKISLVDIPGTYSLFARSDEERVARRFILEGGADIILVVVDASALEANLNLFLQVSLLRTPVILVLNLIDEAKKRGVKIDTEILSETLGVDVIPTVAHKRKTLIPLLEKIISGGRVPKRLIPLCGEAEHLYSELLCKYGEEDIDRRFVSCMAALAEDENVRGCDEEAAHGTDAIFDSLAASILNASRELCQKAVSTTRDKGILRTRRVDKILTGKLTAFPVMLLFLAVIFFLTLVLASYPSDALSKLFLFLEEYILSFLYHIGAPDYLTGALVMGIYRTLSQVVAVMLPPMLIFFPFFSILEDSGYLPRVAYNLDYPFSCVGTSGKQSLTMCMGLGCNAVGVVGCRIMETKRERDIGIITNSLMPCNGRLPMLISLVGIFFIFAYNTSSSALVALGLTVLILLSIIATFISTLILSKTLYKGAKASFIVELPPYRKPRLLSVIYHALKDKCLSILLRAVIVSAPVGLLVWLLGNIDISGVSILSRIADFLNPVGELFGMDGAIILSFVLAIPANEIVIPTLVMIYSSSGAIGEAAGIEFMRELFISNGWSAVTAICTALFALFHFPCSTTLITIYKETRSKRATLIAFLLPTVIGLLLAFLVNAISKIFI